MKLLLHTCCAPCSVYVIDSLRKEGIEPTCFWFNPNIHPYMEYKQRRDTLKEYTKSIRSKCYI
ncbi:MAG: epoxyqueuosine reductase QueH [Candidatus Scatovivens sp.]